MRNDYLHVNLNYGEKFEGKFLSDVFDTEKRNYEWEDKKRRGKY
jgi:hypothetical protein